jgi:predicted PurR-regulated permease PerM
MARPEVRVVTVRPSTILMVFGIAVLVGLMVAIAFRAWHVLTWILIAMVLATALNPAVAAFERRGMKRGWASTLVFGLAMTFVTAIGFLVIPPLAVQVSDFVLAVPDFIDDVVAGRGPLGFLQDEYQIVDRIREAIDAEGAAGVLGLGEFGLDLVRSVVTTVVGIVTIVFLTYFMLLEGPRTTHLFLELLPTTIRVRFERVANEIYRTIAGYVTGNLFISLVAGVTSAVVLFAVGSDYAIALALVVAILDLIPLAGATLAAIIVTTIAFLDDPVPAGIVVLVYFIVYQQIENHLLQPLVYGRTVQLSPLAVLIAVLIGAQLAGVLGALGAIPVAGTIQVVLLDYLRHRRERLVEPAAPV